MSANYSSTWNSGGDTVSPSLYRAPAPEARLRASGTPALGRVCRPRYTCTPTPHRIRSIGLLGLFDESIRPVHGTDHVAPPVCCATRGALEADGYARGKNNLHALPMRRCDRYTDLYFGQKQDPGGTLRGLYLWMIRRRLSDCLRFPLPAPAK
jgi:hypothetical protein